MMRSRSPIQRSPDRRLHRRLAVALAADERGATAAFVAVAMLMLLGMVALAVDVGMLVGARTDSQRVADSAALAGAASFITAPDDADRPRTWAIEYASKNRVHKTIADVRPEDVDVLMAEKKVRVRVRNIAARGNAIRTVFARVLGWDEVNVGTSAAAEASAAGAGNCMLPLALPDRWTETADGDDLFLGPARRPLHARQPGPGCDGRQSVSQPGPLPAQAADLAATSPASIHGDINDLSEPLIEIKVQSGPADPEDPDYVASPCTRGRQLALLVPAGVRRSRRPRRRGRERPAAVDPGLSRQLDHDRDRRHGLRGLRLRQHAEPRPPGLQGSGRHPARRVGR